METIGLYLAETFLSKLGPLASDTISKADLAAIMATIDSTFGLSEPTSTVAPTTAPTR